MENLPNDVLSNILFRLQAKQLAQMRCMGKSWNAYLSQSSFLKSHLNRSFHNNDGVLLIFFDIFLFYTNSVTTRPSLSPHMGLSNFIKPPVDIYPNYGGGEVIGSVNGLICFKYGSGFNSNVIYIWNPSLSAKLTLPLYSASPHFDNWITSDFFRFGFDPKTDDYKVIKSTERVKLTTVMSGFKTIDYSTPRKCLQIEVYSMRRGSWKLITQKIPSHLTWVYNQDHMCVDGHDGHLHWLGKTDFWLNSVDTILAFDLGAETFREIPLPDSIRDGKANSNNLGVLAGKLCVISRVVPYGKCEVWVMNEYGVAESWVRLHAFLPFSGHLKPYGFTLHNEFLFQVDTQRLALYDTVARKSTNFFKFDGAYKWAVKVVDYVDSLVWVTPADSVKGAAAATL